MHGMGMHEMGMDGHGMDHLLSALDRRGGRDLTLLLEGNSSTNGIWWGCGITVIANHTH